MVEFRGSYTVLVTPFTADGLSVDEPAIRRLVDWQIAEGVPGIIPLGSNGEFLSITEAERTQIVTATIEQAAGRIPVLVGATAEWAEDAIRMAREAETLGADGLMIAPPFYSAPSEDELFAHFKRIGEAVSIPIMLYNNPRTTNVDLVPTLVARLAQIDTVRYIKESSKDVTRIREIQRLCGERMTVFCGHHAFESYLVGAVGYVSVCGNIVPRMSADLYNLTVTKNDAVAGRDLYYRLLPLLVELEGNYYVGSTKAAMKMLGMPMGEPRLPRLPVPPQKYARIEAVLTELGVLRHKAA